MRLAITLPSPPTRLPLPGRRAVANHVLRGAGRWPGGRRLVLVAVVWGALLAGVRPAPLAAQGAPDSAAVLETVLAYIDALAARDTAALRALSWAWATSVSVAQPGSPESLPRVADLASTIASVTARTARWEGRVWDWRIEQHGDLAAFTAPYAAWLDGRLAQCGVDRYTLVRGQGTWRVAHLAFTRQVAGCASPPRSP